MELIQVHAVVPAAGEGTRMNCAIPKQCINILHSPVIIHTLKAILRIKWIKHVAVVLDLQQKNLIVPCLNELGDERITIADGGISRHKSIHLGLKHLKKIGCKSNDIVIVHDGVRPFLDEKIMEIVVEGAKQYGASGLILPLVSTVISVDKNMFLDKALDRSKFRASETPQAFRADVLSTAYEKCSDRDFIDGTECLFLVDKYANVKPKLFDGSLDCWKITHKKDIYAAEGVIKEARAVVIAGSKSAAVCAILPCMMDILSKTFSKVENEVKYHDHNIGEKLDLQDVKGPNIVFIYEKLHLSEVINQTYSTTQQSHCLPLSVVHIVLKEVEYSDWVHLRDDARKTAKGREHMIQFYICTSLELLSTKVVELSNITASLLFHSDYNLSGQIMFL